MFTCLKINKIVITLLLIIVMPFSRISAQQNIEAVILEEFIYEEAPFPSCHASTIAETSEGIVAAWFGGTYEKHKDVEIWFSRKINGKWTVPVSVADGIQDNDRYPCWNPVLFQVPDGDLMLFYKVGPDPQSWWGILKTSEDNGESWSKALKLPDGVLGPAKNKPVLLDNGILISPSSTEHNGWQIHLEVSGDTGKSWEITDLGNNSETFNIIQPSILVYRNGKLQVLCRSRENRIITLWSEDYGKTFSPPKAIELPNPNSGIDAVTLKNCLQLLVYNHSEKIKDEWGGPRTPLNVAVSEDGENWKQVLTLENEPGEYSYPAVIQTKDGLIHVTYTWNRKKIKHVVIDPLKFSLSHNK